MDRFYEGLITLNDVFLSETHFDKGKFCITESVVIDRILIPVIIDIKKSIIRVTKDSNINIRFLVDDKYIEKFMKINIDSLKYVLKQYINGQSTDHEITQHVTWFWFKLDKPTKRIKTMCKNNSEFIITHPDKKIFGSIIRENRSITISDLENLDISDIQLELPFEELPFEEI